MIREEWFPTCIWYENLIADNNYLKKIILNMMKDDKGVKKSNVGGWQSNDINKKDFNSLITIINEKTIQIHKELEYPQNVRLEVSNIWTNVNFPKTVNRMHDHPLGILSGTYYVQVDNKTGDIEFEDPRRKFRYLESNISKKNRLVWEFVKYKPKDGLLIIFPAWLNHFVEINESINDRISISFNIVLVNIDGN